MWKKILLSTATGQAIFWRYGYDQIGLFMKPKVEFGEGQKISNWLYSRVPQTATAAWIIKAVEVLTDAGKIPIEGALYKKHGYAPDVVAALISQPKWSIFETAEKLTGAILYPHRVTRPEQVKVSLGCIYGSVFRYALAAGCWQLSKRLAFATVPRPKASQPGTVK